MVNTQLKIVNNSTNNELQYDLSKYPQLNDMYEYTWRNLLDYLMLYHPSLSDEPKSEKAFSVEISDSTEQPDDANVHGVIFNDLSIEEVVDYVKYVRAFKPSVEHTKAITLRKNEKR